MMIEVCAVVKSDKRNLLLGIAWTTGGYCGTGGIFPNSSVPIKACLNGGVHPRVHPTGLCPILCPLAV